MNDEAYGLWPLVILNSFVFIIFAFSFAKPQSKRDWRSLGAFSAFIVALFTEMYGFPLTIYVLSGWIQTRFPGSDPFTHNAGHLWHTLFGLKGDPHFDLFHIVSYILIGAGFWILSAAWDVLHRAQQHHELATSGIYARLRHPQYVAFVYDHARFSVSVADAPHVGDVSYPRHYVYAACGERGARDARNLWSAIHCVRRQDTALRSEIVRQRFSARA